MFISKIYTKVITIHYGMTQNFSFRTLILEKVSISKVSIVDAFVRFYWSFGRYIFKRKNISPLLLYYSAWFSYEEVVIIMLCFVEIAQNSLKKLLNINIIFYVIYSK